MHTNGWLPNGWLPNGWLPKGWCPKVLLHIKLLGQVNKVANTSLYINKNASWSGRNKDWSYIAK